MADTNEYEAAPPVGTVEEVDTKPPFKGYVEGDPAQWTDYNRYEGASHNVSRGVATALHLAEGKGDASDPESLLGMHARILAARERPGFAETFLQPRSFKRRFFEKAIVPPSQDVEGTAVGEDELPEGTLIVVGALSERDSQDLLAAIRDAGKNVVLNLPADAKVEMVELPAGVVAVTTGESTFTEEDGELVGGIELALSPFTDDVLINALVGDMAVEGVVVAGPGDRDVYVTCGEGDRLSFSFPHKKTPTPGRLILLRDTCLRVFRRLWGLSAGSYVDHTVDQRESGLVVVTESRCPPTMSTYAAARTAMARVAFTKEGWTVKDGVPG